MTKNDHHGGRSALAEYLGVGLAILVVGGFVGAESGEAGEGGTPRRVVEARHAPETDAVGYDAVRGRAEADPSAAAAARRAMSDGVVDADEASSIVPALGVRHAGPVLETADARRGLSEALADKGPRR